MVADLECGWESPVFACLDLSHSDTSPDLESPHYSTTLRAKPCIYSIGTAACVECAVSLAMDRVSVILANPYGHQARLHLSQF